MGGMPILSTSVGPVAAVFLQGFALGLGLIVAIGAQNAFVLRQGLRREHVGAVVAFCALADAALITAGVFGMARALWAIARNWPVCWRWRARRFWRGTGGKPLRACAAPAACRPLAAARP
jgi:hypothetical protein